MADAADRARRRELLEAIRSSPREWTTGEVRRLYAASGWGPNRSVARADLQALAETGHLIEDGPENARVYRLSWRLSRKKR